MKKTILLHQVTTDELSGLIEEAVHQAVERMFTIFKENEDVLFTRTEACEFLKIDSSTLWHWTQKGKITAYGIGARRYYKKLEIIESLKPVKF